MRNKTFSPNKIESYKVSESYNIKTDDNETLQMFICLCCSCLVWEPLICDKCDNYFCKECIKKFIVSCNNKYKCPLKCKNVRFREMTRTEKKFIDKIKLRCKHNGCNQFINYTNYKNHLEKCKYRLYHCKNNSCKKEGYYAQMEEHSKKCIYRICYCELCGAELIFNKAQKHFDNDCPQELVKCPFCSIEMKRADFRANHQSNDASCLKDLIKIKNKKLNEYENEFKRLKNINNELNKTIEEYKNAYREQKQEIKTLQESKNILMRKNEDKRKTINELKQYFNNGLNKFIQNENYEDKPLNINNEINKRNNQYQNQHMNTETNFYPKKSNNGRNTERRNNNKNMRRVNSEANFGYLKTDYIFY